MPRHFRPFGALSFVVAGTLLLTLSATPAHAEDYPSWDDVQNARANQAATAAAIDTIESLLGGLEDQAAELGRAAQIKAEEYNVASAALSTAAARAARLDNQAQDAAAKARESSRRAGQLAAQIARTGGSSLSLNLFLSNDADDLLSNLGAMSKLTEQSALVYQQATVDNNLARSLTDQAKVAEKGRLAKADEAQAALDAAQSAAESLLAEVAAQQAAADQMYSQLATLKGTTAETERMYIQGITAPPPPAAPSNPTAPSNPGTPSNPSTPSNPTPPATPSNPTPPPSNPPPPSSSAVETAIAFAYAQIGDWYLYGGSGPDQWDCSGLTKASYGAAGVNIGIHSANSQYNTLASRGRLVPLAQIQRGDLLFFADGGNANGNKYHTTLYLGGGKMIEAQIPGTRVTVSNIRYSDLVPYAGRPTG